MKRWVQEESPSEQPLITAATPQPGASPAGMGRAGAPGPADQGQEVGPAGGRGAAAHPHPDLGTARKAFLSG